jgi:hypothetical protein
VVRGFLMPRVPDRFTVRISLPGGPDTVLAQVQYLLNSDDYLRARGLHVDDRLRLEFLRDTGEALGLLHRLGICVGDLSPNNLLFSLTARPRCYFLDCDAMRLDGDSVLAQAETPEWHLPDAEAEELATPASDAYKFGLLTIRLFAGDQQVRNPAAARRRLNNRLLRLAENSLKSDPLLRTTPAQWLDRLDDAIRRTPSAPPPSPAPEPPPATPGPITPPRLSVPRPTPARPQPPRRRWPAYVAAGAVAVAVFIGLLNGGTETPPSTSPTRLNLPTGLYNYGLGPEPPQPGLGTPTRYPWLTPPLLIPSRLYPSLLEPLLCPISDVDVGAGVNPQSTRMKAAVRSVSDVLCELNDGGDVLVGSPGKTQRDRLARLSRKGPFKTATIIGIRTGPNGKPQANVVFEPSGAESPGCWRSRLSLTEDDDGYGVAALTGPVSSSCP